MGSRSSSNRKAKAWRPGNSLVRDPISNRQRRAGFECLESRWMLSALSPLQVNTAYGINQIHYGTTIGNGAGQTIAIIDPGDDPTIAGDLVTFDTEENVAAPPSFTVTGENGTRPLYPTISSISSSGGTVTVNTASNHGLSTNDYIQITGAANTAFNGTFQVTKLSATSFQYSDSAAGTTSTTGATLVNPADTDEIAGDVEWAHAIAPAKIVLIEMSAFTGGDITNAITNAVPTTGASVVSMSFGSLEYASETSLSTASQDDGIYTEAGVSYVDDSGDNGAPGYYSSTSPNVLSAGATNLYLNSNNSYNHETAWSNSIEINTATESGNKVTINTSYSGGIVNGQPIQIAGVGVAGYNGTFTVSSVLSSTSFTYTDANSGLANGYGGSVVQNSSTVVEGNGGNADGYSNSGTWTTVSSSSGFGGSYETASPGASTSTWDISTAKNTSLGFYVTWVANASFASNASYSFYDGSVSPENLITTYTANQKVAPTDNTGTALDPSIPFQKVAEFVQSKTGTIIVVLNAAGANGTVCADSVAVTVDGNGGGSGGGLSQYESAPSYQSGLTIHNGTSTISAGGMRAVPDVSVLGGDASPVAIVDSTGNNTTFFGTSLSTPVWAGLIAIADEGRALNSLAALNTGASQSLQTDLYSLPSDDFHSILGGYNGYSTSSAGYNLVTGLGSPVANLLIPDLAQTSIDYTVPSTGTSHVLLLERIDPNGLTVGLYDNGLLVGSAPADTLSDVNITDGNTTNDTLTVDYADNGVFAGSISFDHTVTAGYQTVVVKSPNGASNTTDLSEGTNGASTVTVDGSTQTMNLQGVSEVDLDAGSGGDAFTLSGNGGTSGLQRVEINGGAGNDTLDVDSSSGLFAMPTGSTNGIFFNGTAAFDKLALTQTGGSTQTSDTYSVGPNNGQGSDVIVGSSGTQTVYFQNLAPVTDNVPSTTVTINATPASNAINYAQGPGGGIFTGNTGIVTIDNQESYEFNNKTNLIVNGIAGSNTINLNNPTTPAGLTSLTVNGGSNLVGNTLIANGTSSTIAYAPTTVGAGGITNAGPVPITFTEIAGVTINVAGNSLTYTSPANGNVGSDLILTPDATDEGGTIAGSNRSANTLLVPLTFTNLASGSVTFATANTGRTDTLQLNGTSGDDVFEALGGSLSIFTGSPSDLLAISPVSINVLELDGLGGNDTFDVDGDLPYTSTLIDGSGIANFSEPTGAITVNLADSTIPTNTSIAGYGGTVYISAADVVNLDGSVGDGGDVNLLVNGTAENDNITYTPSGSNAGTFQNVGAFQSTTVTPVFNFSDIDTFTLDPGAGTNTVNIVGTAASDTITAVVGAVTADTQVTVNALEPVQIVTADTQSLVIDGGTGNDDLVVNSASGPVTIPIIDEGGTGTDALTLSGGTATADTYKPGPQIGSGTDLLTFAGGNESISFSNLAPVFDSVAGPLVVDGTNSPDAINYSEGFSNLAKYMAGTLSATWGQVSVDSQEPIEFINKTTLTLNGLAGSDQFNLNNPDTPTGLTGISVNGGDPTADDTLIVNGESAGAAIDFAPTAADAGTISVTGQPLVTFSTIEQVTANGQSGEDALTYTSPDNGIGSDLTYTPGATADSGSIAGAQLGSSTPLVPLTFTNLGTFGRVVFATANTGPTDDLLVYGTPASDVFNVGASVIQILKAQVNSVFVTLPITATGVNDLELVGESGADTYNLTGTLPYNSTVVDSGSADPVNLSGASSSVLVNLADSTLSTNTTITGYGGTVTIIGTDVVNLNANQQTVEAVGTSQSDNITYTPTGTSAGTFSLAGLNTVFNLSNVLTGSYFTVDGGAGGLVDELTLQGTASIDLFEIDQGAANAQVLAGSSLTPLLPVHLNSDVTVLNVLGLGGENTFQVKPGTIAGGEGPFATLQINIDGNASGQFNALLVAGSFGTGTLATLPASDFVVVNKNSTTSGTVRVFDNTSGSPTALPDIDYIHIQTITPYSVGSSAAGGSPGLSAQTLVMGPDTYEPNDDLTDATFLGSGSTIQIQNATIFPNGNEFPGQPADQDYYQVVAQSTGTLEYQVYFKDYSTTLLPAGGQLNLQAYDVNGNLVASATSTTVGSNFGAIGATANARIRIPVVAGNSYYLRVFGPTGNEINGYNATIINTPAPVPTGVELSHSVVTVAVTNGGAGYTSPPTVTFSGGGSPIQQATGIAIISGGVVTGVTVVTNGGGYTSPPTVTLSGGGFTTAATATASITDTGDLPANAPNDDTGRSQFDNVTFDSTPTIYVRVPDALLLNDLPGNPVSGTPIGVNPIPIPFNSSTAITLTNPTTPGYRIALYDGGDGAPGSGQVHTLDPNDPTFIGYAQQAISNGAIVPGLYVLAIGSQGTDSLADGVHNITARVQLVDPANPTMTGFGSYSAALQITVDTVPPPVAFGTPNDPNSGILAGGDSGVTSFPPTFIDNITNDTSPTFYGTAEADAIVRLYAAIDGNPANTAPSNIVYLGTAQAIPTDGTNASPLGQWTIQTTVNLNNPTYFAHDGLRTLFVTAEDLAGNVSTPVTGTTSVLQIFVDTQGPVITNVAISNSPLYNLFALKTAGGVASPTPLVDGLDISVQGEDALAAGFLFDAVYAPVAVSQGLYTVKGDANGIVTIASITYTPGVVVAGQQPTGTIQLTFAKPLPDDRYTLTVSDGLVDVAGNALDGVSNASQPNGLPTFPTGDGVPGSNFVARFTVDSRPHIGTWAGGNAYLDTNGNGIFDPTNLDASNRDASYTIGYTSDKVFAGNFAVPSSLNGPASTAVADGFSKLSAYGLVGSSYRWLIESDQGTPIINYADPGIQINALPVAGDWNPTGSAPAGHDDVGLFNGTTWYLYTGGQYDGLDGGTVTKVTAWHTGSPIVGDFDGSGHIDLATYQNGVFYFQLWDAADDKWDIDRTITVTGNGLQLGPNVRPVAADMDQDGITDIGLYVPQTTTGTTGTSSDWYWDLSNDPATNTSGVALTQSRITGQVNTLNHPFSSVSLGGADLFYQFGNSFALPVVGLWDPPMPSVTSTAATVPAVLDVTLVGTAKNDSFSFAHGTAANTWTVTLNGVAKTYTAKTIVVSFNGEGGTNTAIVHGYGANQTAVLRPDSGTFTGTGYDVIVVAQSITADAAGGSGQVTFYGSPTVTNYFSGAPTAASMSDSATLAWKTFYEAETGYQSVVAYATVGGKNVAQITDGGVQSKLTASGVTAKLASVSMAATDYALTLFDFGSVTATLKNKLTTKSLAAINYVLMTQ